MFFRKNPFKGEYAIFAGLGDLLDFIIQFKFNDEEIAYLRKVLPNAEDDFF